MSDDGKTRAQHEMAYCEAILAKSKLSVLLQVLPSSGLSTWQHYPEKEVFDPASGAQWYYHCHDDSDALGEHGHFHCFVRPDGHDSPACHLVAVGVTARGKITRLFTVNQWVVGGQWYDAEATNHLLGRFNVELAYPDYLVNRWLTAVLTRYEDEIVQLNKQRDSAIALIPGSHEEALENRKFEVTSEFKFTTDG